LSQNYFQNAYAPAHVLREWRAHVCIIQFTWKIQYSIFVN